MNALFDSFSFRSRLQEQVQAAVDAVAVLTDAELVDGTTSDVADRLFKAHLPDLPRLDPVGITKSTEMAHTESRPVYGFGAATASATMPKTSVVAFYVPFTGEPKWFEAIPSQAIGDRPRGLLQETSIKLFVPRGTKSAKEVHREFLALLERVSDILKALAEEREDAKSRATEALCLAIDDEKARREQDREFMDELPYPYR
ncbi:MAG TPA: hypothetical protein VNI20_13915 [Fimbriimonadaceae bacterium]|nr:hypothetical protein [Fimbriimonadaceae bacterium]